MFKYLYAAVWIFYVPINLKSNDSPIFKKTDPNPQLDMSTSPSMQLGVRASKKYIDSNATYRNKNDQKVQGYVTNITEMVEDGKPSIITSVQVETAVFADCHFLQEAVGNSERVTNTTVEDLYADGAYQSPDNRAFAEGHAGMRLKTGKMQGGNRWKLIRHDEDGLTVVDKQTGNQTDTVCHL